MTEKGLGEHYHTALAVKSHFIITGSYLGKIYESDFRDSSGDVTAIPIYTLSFEEFLLAYDSALYEKYQALSLDTPDSGNIYTLLKEAYDIYCQVGGYPKVVETYLETRSFEKAQGVLINPKQSAIGPSAGCIFPVSSVSVQRLRKWISWISSRQADATLWISDLQTTI